MVTVSVLAVLLLAVAAEAGYIFTFPKSLEAEKFTKFCLSGNNLDIPSWTPGEKYEVSIALVLELAVSGMKRTFNYNVAIQDITVPEFSNCPDFQAPKYVGKYNATVTVSVVYQDMRDRLFSERTEVSINKPDYITLIQTDKPLYKPGQVVKFRAMTMDYQLMAKTFGFSLISVEDPNGRTLKQWRDVTTQKGLVSLEMPLGEEPTLGVWKIKAAYSKNANPLEDWNDKGEHPEDTFETTFKVDEYVLPKFEVVVTPPKYLLPTTTTIHGTVCAKYTYGKPVKGTVKLSVCIEETRYRRRDSEKRPCAKVIDTIDGCYEFYVDAELIKLNSKKYHYWNDLIITANVTDEATDVELSGMSRGPRISQEVINLKLEDDSDNFYKPGFPYRGRVIATNPDGTPAIGEEIEVTATSGYTWYLYSPYVGIRPSRDNFEYSWNKTFTTDSYGIINFVITDVDASISYLSLHAHASQYDSRYSFDNDYITTYKPTARLTITRWHSASNSYIYIKDVDETAACGSDLELDVFYTTPPESTYRFQTMVKAGDRVVFSSNKMVRFDGVSRFDFIAVKPEQLLEKREPVEPKPIPEVYIPEIDPPRPELEEPLIRPKLQDSMAEEATPIVEEVFVKEEAKVLGNEGMDGKVEEEHLIGHFKIQIPVFPDMSPDAQLLIYYMRPDGEIIATSIKFNVETCFKNKVAMDFEKKSVYPGDNVKFTLQASAQSTCFVGMVDKSINLLGGQNQLTPAKVFEKVRSVARPQTWVSYWREDQDYCERNYPEHGINEDGIYHHYNTYLSATGVDAVKSFRDFNTWIITDGTVETRPCKEEQRMLYYAMPISRNGMPGLAGGVMRKGPVAIAESAMGQDGEVEEPERIRMDHYYSLPQEFAEVGAVYDVAVDYDNGFSDDSVEPDGREPNRIRSLFPETWLWTIFEIGETGVSEFGTVIPDTITEWIGNSLCTHPEDGVGVSDLTSVTGFQPFFVSLTMPYAAVRGENMSLPVTVYNYLDKCLRLDLQLDANKGFQISGDNGRRVQFCLCGDKSETVKFYVMPIVIGEIELLVKTVSIEDNGACTNFVMDTEHLGVSDGVQRHLLVEPEGVPKEDTMSEYMCEDGAENSIWRAPILLPDNLVEDSARSFVSVIGDIMGPTLSNLKNLLRMPYGCGEQNMASWAPNIYVLQYLINTEQLTSKTEDEAKTYMRVGYKRQMKYRHSDFSYSAFGENNYRNDSGSIWLTAFVVKSMAQSSKFIAIDEADISNSVDWILDQQLPDGCFPRVGKVFSSYMLGGLKSGDNPAGLTAFIMIALLEASIGEIPNKDKYITGVQNGFKCLNRFDPHNLDIYTLTITAYVYSLVDDKERFRSTMSLLKKEKNTEGGIHWERKDLDKSEDRGYYWRASSAEVEMTAYVVLAILTVRGRDGIGQTQPIIQWLTKQRNPYGGFSSTQDTVIALQGLATFGGMTYSGESSLNLTVSDGKMTKDLWVYPDNLLLYQKVPVASNTGEVTIDVNGKGCALLQVTTRYNTYAEPKQKAFKLKFDDFQSNRNPRNCKTRALYICAKYALPQGSSNMAIIEVKMQTGWEAITESIEELEKNGIIARFEVDKNYVQLYFDEITKSEHCVVIEAQKTLETTTKPAVIRVYDYYETSHEVSITYDVQTTCERRHVATKQDIPEDNAGLDCSIEQCRVPDTPFEFFTPKGCPNCGGSMDDNQLETAVCNARRIYKAAVARKKKLFSIKLMSNFTTFPKSEIGAFVNPVLNEGCDCQILKAKSQRAMFLTIPQTWETSPLNLKDEIRIGQETTIIKMTTKIEKKVNNIKGRKAFCHKLERRRRSRERKLRRNGRKMRLRAEGRGF